MVVTFTFIVDFYFISVRFHIINRYKNLTFFISSGFCYIAIYFIRYRNIGHWSFQVVNYHDANVIFKVIRCSKIGFYGWNITIYLKSSVQLRDFRTSPNICSKITTFNKGYGPLWSGWNMEGFTFPILLFSLNSNINTVIFLIIVFNYKSDLAAKVGFGISNHIKRWENYFCVFTFIKLTLTKQSGTSFHCSIFVFVSSIILKTT